MDKNRFHVGVRGASDRNEDFHVENKWLRGFLREFTQKRDRPWDKLSKSAGEI